MEELEAKVPIEKKCTLTVKEASAYSGIGVNKIREISKSPLCDFTLYVGKKTLIKRQKFKDFLNRASEI